MKTYKVKNYKGNLVESLKKFSYSHKGMKIVEACEDGEELKIKAEESTQKIEEVSKQELTANIQKWIDQQRFRKEDLQEILKGKRNGEDDTVLNMQEDLDIVPDPRHEFGSDPSEQIYYKLIKKMLNDPTSKKPDDAITQLIFAAVKLIEKYNKYSRIDMIETKTMRKAADELRDSFTVNSIKK